MKEVFLDILCCPRCQASLKIQSLSRDEFGINAGNLSCEKCPATFPVTEGIPRFVSQKEGATQERFGFEWMRYPGSLPEDETIFLEETQVEKREWKNRWVLDAGCGMGRYSRVAHSLGAHVVALDLGGALARLQDLAQNSERLHLVQGDLLHLPLKKEKFDIIYSLGVIHHTVSPRTCVQAFTQRLKPNGKLTVWVYGRADSYQNFKSNPLKLNRKSLEKIRFFVWIIVDLRELLSHSLRSVTVHLPYKLLYCCCYPLAVFGKIPFFKFLTFSVHPLWRVRLQENFDWLAPPIQSHHTKEEVKNWFEENRVSVIKILPHGFVPKVGVLGEKK